MLFNTSSTVALEDTALYVLVNDTAFETDWCVAATLWLLHSYQSSDYSLLQTADNASCIYNNVYDNDILYT